MQPEKINIPSLFPDAEMEPVTPDPGVPVRRKTRSEIFNDYEAFTEKFKPKKTTDDCYTPEIVYQAVRDWVSENIRPLDGVPIVRPFFPGGDFEDFDYPEGCVVLDNPPFSILSKIIRFYHDRRICYFLFAPTLTCANSAKGSPATHIITGSSVTYANGAKIPTSFLTNMDCGDLAVWVSGDLTKRIEEADAENLRAQKKSFPAYSYPINVGSPAILQTIAKRGVDLKISQKDCVKVSRLDSQKGTGKAIFGSGWLFSERAAAERAAAERAAKRDIVYWELSDREKKIIESMG